jgi:hypothetical protein
MKKMEVFEDLNLLQKTFCKRSDVLLRNEILQFFVADAAQILILKITELVSVI